MPSVPTCPRALPAIRTHAPHVPYVLYVPHVPTRPMYLASPRAQVYFTDRKIKDIGFNEIKWRFVRSCFQRCWILIWTLIRISFFQIGSKNIKLFYAEGQNNTYKCWRSKQHLWNNEEHTEGKTCLRKIHNKKIFSNERLTRWKKEGMKTMCKYLYSYAYIWLLKDI